ncbi:hypothetical protein SHIRM173S_02560 [Streptomyces hirsutus]
MHGDATSVVDALRRCVKVADSGAEVFELVVTEHGEDAVARAAARADAVVVVAGNDPHINGRETEADRTTSARCPTEERTGAAAPARPRRRTAGQHRPAATGQKGTAPTPG